MGVRLFCHVALLIFFVSITQHIVLGSGLSFGAVRLTADVVWFPVRYFY